MRHKSKFVIFFTAFLGFRVLQRWWDADGFSITFTDVGTSAIMAATLTYIFREVPERTD